MNGTRTLGMAVATMVVLAGMALSQSWQPLTHTAPFSADVMTLLQDGSILVHEYPKSSGTNHVWKLTPDNTGSYLNGTWTQVASLPSGYSPLYFSTQVLLDGRVIYAGGEYNFLSAVWTNLAAIYDPVADTWSTLAPPPGFANIGDAQSVVLNNGTYMQANALNTQQALLDPLTLTWTNTGTGKADINDEEGWTLLQTGAVLAVDCNNTDQKATEVFSPSTGSWRKAPELPVVLTDYATGSHEIGPGLVRPDGSVFYTGATGHTAILSPATQSWTAGPDFPNEGGQLDIADGPGALEPSGTSMVATSPGVFQPPSHFFEYSDADGLVEISAPSGSTGKVSYEYRLLVLPTGQIMETDGTNSVQIYSPTGSPAPSWAPAITAIPTSMSRGNTYRLRGTQLNGLSEAGYYGDDAQAATNYPMVRLSNNATGHLQYLRAHMPSSRSIAPHMPGQVRFDIPATAETGASTIEVVANGIASDPVAVTIN